MNTGSLIAGPLPKMGRTQLAQIPVPQATRTHRPVPHHEIVEALVETLSFRQPLPPAQTRSPCLAPARWPAVCLPLTEKGVSVGTEWSGWVRSREGLLWLLRASRTNTKLKGLRHWLRSSRQLLRGSQQRGCVHRPSPLMRSPLSRFQTPTAPRRVSRFFRVWWLDELPRRADHSAYFGLATFS